jgi:AraC-like DNA-binding protein
MVVKPLLIFKIIKYLLTIKFKNPTFDSKKTPLLKNTKFFQIAMLKYFIFIFLFFCFYTRSTAQLDSSALKTYIQSLDTAKGENRFLLYNKLTRHYSRVEPIKGLFFANIWLKENQKLPDTTTNKRLKITTCLERIAICYQYKNNPDSMLMTANQIFTLAESCEKNSKEYYTILSSAHSLHARVCDYQTKYADAAKYYMEAIKTAELGGKTSGLASLYMNMASSLDMDNRMEEALKYYQISEKYTLEIKDTINYTRLLYNQCSPLQKTGQHKKVIELMTKAIPLAQKHLPSLLPKLLTLKAETHIQQGECYIAIADLDKAAAINDVDMMFKVSLWDTYLKCYKTMGNYEKALQASENYHAMLDTMLIKSSDSKVLEFQTQYETLKKDKEINQLITQNDIKNLRLWLFGALLAFVLSAGGIGFYLLQQKKKLTEARLEEEKQVLQQRFDRLLSLHFEEKVPDLANPDDAFLAQLLKVFESKIPDENFSIDDLPKEMGVSRALLFKKIKLITGKTPAELLREIRMRKAHHLLMQRNKSISEIAFEVGYNNIDSFGRTFKDFFGKSPSATLRDSI